MALASVFQGTGGNAWTGRSVSNAGDVNADGYDDIIIGAPRADQGGVDAGTSYVIYGGPGGTPRDVDLGSLNGVNGFRITGAETGGQAGYAVSNAGDVNNDGIADILIGAREADPPGAANAGSAFVVFGQSGGFGAELDLSTLDGTTGFRIDGDNAGGRIGRSVAITGDLNGDGIDDMIIGAPDADLPGRSGAGAAYVVFGKDQGTAFEAQFSTADLDGTNGFRILGADAGDYAGMSVSGAGDFNGDGIDDLIVGAEGADPGSLSNAGESYILFGSSSGFAADFDLRGLTAADGVILAGDDSSSYSGASVAGGGDFNGDGIGDVIVGAPFETVNGVFKGGTAFVVFGSDSGLPGQIALGSLNGTDGFRIDGTRYGEMGFSVANAGDVNGDGIDDVLAGAYRSGTGADNLQGSVALVFGRSGAFSPVIDDVDLDGTNGYRFFGMPGDRMGFSSAGGGDTDGDGNADLVFGALYAGSGAPGAAYAFLGGTDNLETLSTLSGGGGRIDVALLCFAAGTLIDTPRGPRPVEALRPGDAVLTRDHGAQALIWTGARRLETAELSADPKHRPIRIRAGALGAGVPKRDLLVSPQHRVLLSNETCACLPGTGEALAAAAHLTGLPGIERDDSCTPVTFWHLLCDRHEVLQAEGIGAESLYLGPQAIQVLTLSQKTEIAEQGCRCVHRPARRFLSGRAARALVRRSAAASIAVPEPA